MPTDEEGNMKPDDLRAALMLLGFKLESSYIPIAYTWTMVNSNVHVKYSESSKYRPYCISLKGSEYTINWHSEEDIWTAVLKQIQTQ